MGSARTFFPAFKKLYIKLNILKGNDLHAAQETGEKHFNNEEKQGNFELIKCTSNIEGKAKIQRSKKGNSEPDKKPNIACSLNRSKLALRRLRHPAPRHETRAL